MAQFTVGNHDAGADLWFSLQVRNNFRGFENYFSPTMLNTHIVKIYNFDKYFFSLTEWVAAWLRPP